MPKSKKSKTQPLVSQKVIVKIGEEISKRRRKRQRRQRKRYEKEGVSTIQQPIIMPSVMQPIQYNIPPFQHQYPTPFQEPIKQLTIQDIPKHTIDEENIVKIPIVETEPIKKEPMIVPSQFEQPKRYNILENIENIENNPFDIKLPKNRPFIEEKPEFIELTEEFIPQIKQPKKTPFIEEKPEFVELTEEFIPQIKQPKKTPFIEEKPEFIEEKPEFIELTEEFIPKIETKNINIKKKPEFIELTEEFIPKIETKNINIKKKPEFIEETITPSNIKAEQQIIPTSNVKEKVAQIEKKIKRKDLIQIINKSENFQNNKELYLQYIGFPTGKKQIKDLKKEQLIQLQNILEREV